MEKIQNGMLKKGESHSNKKKTPVEFLRAGVLIAGVNREV